MIQQSHSCVYTPKNWKQEFQENTQVHNIIHNSQKMEVTQVSNDWWTDQENLTHAYNKTSFGLEKEGNSDIGCNVDETWRQYVSEISRLPKDNGLMIPPIWAPKVVKFIETESSRVAARGWEWEKGELVFSG